jgi:uncharacterized iron-regulated protein
MRCLTLPALLAGLIALGLCACATTPVPTPQPPRYLLLGEVHDHAEGHRLRLAVLQAYVEAGGRPAIAMEQFDTEAQPALSAAQERCGEEAACIIAAAGTPEGWDWAHYAPVINLAQRYGLPLLAANLSRDAAASLVRGKPVGGAADARLQRALETTPPEEVLALQTEAVRDAHCGLLPEAMLPRMARAQIARDQVMAEVLREAGRPVVLLAGNGHVRRDIGVPRWLPAEGVEAVAYSEALSPPGRYDREVLLPPLPREDACAALRAAMPPAR